MSQVNENWKQIEQQGSVYYLDTNIKKPEIRKNCPVFYRNQRETETLILYKGCFIVKDTTQDNVVLYAYDARTKTLNYLLLRPDVKTAKKTIDRKIQEGTTIALKYVPVVVTISVTVEVAVFSTDKVINAIPHAIKQIGKTEVDDEKAVSEMLECAIFQQAAENFPKDTD